MPTNDIPSASGRPNDARPRRITPTPDPRPGINLFGHVTGALGLGVAARNTLAMLDATGRRFVAIDVDPGAGRQGADLTWQRAVEASSAAVHGVNWFQLNPPDVATLLATPGRRFDPVARANVCVPFWELPRLPVGNAWVETLEAMDLVLAPSRFVLDAVRASAPRVPVVHYRQTVLLPEGVIPRRSDFGLPEDAVLFHVAADVSSDLERKNPLAAIRAFRAAFPQGGPAGLVVKLGQTRAGHAWADPGALVAEADGHPGIRIVDRDLPYREALSLAASCDVCVSLHRAEGLGLGMLEAMSLGKPVVATAWSGNMDFTSESDACLVGFDLVPVQGRHPAYDPALAGEGQVWAEPRLADAVAWMRALAGNAHLRADIGARAGVSAASLRERVLGGEILEAVDRTVSSLADRVSDRARMWRWRRLMARATLGRARSRALALIHRCVARIRG